MRYDEIDAEQDTDHEVGPTVEALTEATARRHPVYDLLYAVPARRHGARVLTLDNRLSRLVVDMGVGLA